MKEKYIEDYIEELSFYFPQIEEKELTRMVKQMSSLLTFYLKNWYRGFSVVSKTNTLVDDGHRYKFEVKRIFGRGHLMVQKLRVKNRNKKKNVRK